MKKKGTRVGTLHKTFGPKGFMAGVEKFWWGQWTAMANHGYMNKSSASQIKSFSDKFKKRYKGDMVKYLFDKKRYQFLTDGRLHHHEDLFDNAEIHSVGQASDFDDYFGDNEIFGFCGY